ncbi:BamA/TamA family outer membrane protein [Laspinema olomoucense]|uniref:BamA/TamA family outer membrane protein n=1 Tax=Laspinema olomoucense D3b TaxID=2953688 RepID=A0ABT2N727_9CYAN|nr:MULTISPECIES: BamA/TamA family outer membrane protein [unclassified Laspinema]MCT7971693.1 BamA/TamA family outer membrane protein [Laspinema sp. D3d]MCT7977180.1 BamA/TamA family outer membrane protein [Laspinema sp. D3b]MCT7987930.1 BamA/TamA family outer membrane protein [Laspinema sp. D3a]
MRLSPVLSAVLATCAILSIANPSRGETSALLAPSTTDPSMEVEDLTTTDPAERSPDGPTDWAESSLIEGIKSIEKIENGDAASLAVTQGQGEEISPAPDIVLPESDAEQPGVELSQGDDTPQTPVTASEQAVEEEPLAEAIAPEEAIAAIGAQSDRPSQSPAELLITPPLQQPDVSDRAEDWKRALAQDPTPTEPAEPDAIETEPSTRPVVPETTDEATPETTDEATPEDTDEATPEDTNQTTPRPITPPPLIPPQSQPAPQAEPQVLVAEVVVSGVEGELQDEVYRVISLRPGQTTTRSQLQQDINAIFATGYFSNVRAEPQDTPLGVRVTFVVESNPVLTSVEVRGNQVLPQEVINEIFAEQYGDILNLRDFQEGIKQLNEWYQQNGYVLAQVIDTPQVAADGTVILEVAEGVVESIEIQFINEEGELVDAEGQPIRGRTKEYIVTRELELEPGEVFNRQTIERDLQRVFGLGIFEDVQISLNPGQNPRNVVVVVNVLERSTGSIAAGAGISSASGLFGTLSVQEQNLFGRNLKLGTELQIGQREVLFDVNFTDPWIAGWDSRTSYTVNLFRRRSISFIFDGGDPEIELPDDGGRPRILRFGGGLTFSRPLDNGWRASLGTQYQRVSTRDDDGDIARTDEAGNDLSFSGDGKDDLFTFQLSGTRDLRDSALQPTSGSVLRISTEQSVPIGLGSIFFNRLRASYNYYIPINLIRFSEGPQTFALSVQGGTVLGDLPPYEAFSLGGTTTVRGYDEGGVGTGRSYVQGSAEYRFPIYSVVGGALFFDAATDLGTGGNVPGRPAEARNKPGSGFGYGLGIRVQSPLGPIRVDFALNDDGGSRFHFGLGERF